MQDNDICVFGHVRGRALLFLYRFSKDKPLNLVQFYCCETGANRIYYNQYPKYDAEE